MAEQEQEENKTEEATPFKLRRARERGIVARSMDLGFLGGLVALGAFIVIAGETLAFRLALMMKRSLAIGMKDASDSQEALAATSTAIEPAFRAIALFGATVLGIILLLETFQLKGIIFSSQPLKPDFSRINPAKGLKRIFSTRMLKEAFKNVVKLGAYSGAVMLVTYAVMTAPGEAASGALGLANAMHANLLWLLSLFIALALFFAGLDQILVRREYARQMRMSRRELTLEAKEREGDPRLKQRRKQIHADLRRRAASLGKLPGSDMLLVNPEHLAVALAYDPASMGAPSVTAKARNRFALAFRREAFRLGIPVIEDRPLARALFKECPTGSEIGAKHYRAVADLYVRLRSGPHDGEAT